MVDEVLRQASEMKDRLIAWRRIIHANPELGLEEKRTSAFVANILGEADIPFNTGISETGVVALVQGMGEKTVALRADMDALPIQEETGLSFASTAKGVMHACGHDGHTAMLLGAALILNRLACRLPGNVKLIFQPAEEQSFVGRGGACQMLAEGVLDSPPVSAIGALHLDPDLPVGTVAVKDGPFMASSMTLEINVLGKSSHGARPQRGIDAVHLAAHLLLALQGLVARDTDALDPKVITVGEVHGGTSPNILASEVLLRGTVRTLTTDMKEQTEKLVSERIPALARALGGDAICSLKTLYPPVVNDRVLANMLREVCRLHPGVGNVRELDIPNMGGDDFAFYAAKVPGILFRLGCSKREGKVALHSSTFDFDENALPVGTGLLALLALKMLEVL